MNPRFFALLMRDAARLLRPAAVVAVAPAAQAPFADHPKWRFEGCLARRRRLPGSLW